METQMQGKTVLITGATSGIGQASAIGIAKLGAHVVVTGRDRARGERGVAEIKAESGNDNVDLMLADLSSMAKVRQIADEFKQRFNRLDVLINNVGYLSNQRRETTEGIEMNLAVNHLAPFVLTHELLPLLKASAPSRVINITGGMPGQGGIDFDNLQAEKSFLGLTTYTHAKNVMMAVSYEFAKQLEGTGVRLVVAYPGSAQTDMTASLTPDMMPFIMRLLWPGMKLFANVVMSSDPADAAVSTIRLASAPDSHVVNGAYYNTKGERAKWPKGLIKSGVPERVWQVSQQLISQKAYSTS